MRFVIVCIIFFAIYRVGFSANTFHVPYDYPSIQVAVDGALNGDMIWVAPGYYPENIDFKGKAITLKSEKGPAVTFIDGNGSGSVVSFHTGEGFDSVLDGFTITNGSGTWDQICGFYDSFGGGIYCLYSSPTIQHCIIEKNEASVYTHVYGGGGGIYCRGGAPVIQYNTIRGNFGGNGGGICAWQSSPVITNNTISMNSSNYGGSGIYIGCNPYRMFISENEISGNIVSSQEKLGGSVYLYESHDCTVFSNTITDSNKKGIYLRVVSQTTLSENEILKTMATGISLHGSSNNTLVRNRVEYADMAIEFLPFENLESDFNEIFHNNFLHNKQNGCDTGCNDWDDGYPGGGNFWDDYDPIDLDHDGIGDTPYFFPGGEDDYPLIYPYNGLDRSHNRIYAGTGGSVHFFLAAGKEHANRSFILLGSISGTGPGMAHQDRPINTALKWDLFTNYMISDINTPTFSNFLGVLDPTGRATATFDTLEPIPRSAGLILHFGYTLLDPLDFVSNPVAIEIAP